MNYWQRAWRVQWPTSPVRSQLIRVAHVQKPDNDTYAQHSRSCDACHIKTCNGHNRWPAHIRVLTCVDITPHVWFSCFIGVNCWSTDGDVCLLCDYILTDGCRAAVSSLRNDAGRLVDFSVVSHSYWLITRKWPQCSCFLVELGLTWTLYLLNENRVTH